MRGADENEYPPKNCVLTQIFEIEAERSISDEEIARLLAPLRKKIMADEFARPRYSSRRWAAAIAALVTTAAALTVFLQNSPAGDLYVSIPDSQVPLAGDPFPGNLCAGCVTLEGKGVGGIELTLWNADTLEPVDTAVTGEDGGYVFTSFPDGSYRLGIALPEGMALEDGSGKWLTVGGETTFVFEKSEMQKRENMDVQLCRTETGSSRS